VGAPVGRLRSIFVPGGRFGIRPVGVGVVVFALRLMACPVFGVRCPFGTVRNWRGGLTGGRRAGDGRCALTGDAPSAATAPAAPPASAPRGSVGSACFTVRGWLRGCAAAHHFSRRLSRRRNAIRLLRRRLAPVARALAAASRTGGLRRAL